jgi:hypothetical protein
MRVILGYGTYKGYSLKELPEGTLQELSRRFPLQADRYDHSDGTSLMVTVAIHEEIARRQLGGEKLKRIPTLKELASDLVTKGYHQLSKTAVGQSTLDLRCCTSESPSNVSGYSRQRGRQQRPDLTGSEVRFVRWHA